jgi:hypothetical protein
MPHSHTHVTSTIVVVDKSCYRATSTCVIDSRSYKDATITRGITDTHHGQVTSTIVVNDRTFDRVTSTCVIGSRSCKHATSTLVVTDRCHGQVTSTIVVTDWSCHLVTSTSEAADGSQNHTAHTHVNIETPTRYIRHPQTSRLKQPPLSARCERLRLSFVGGCGVP